MCSSTYKNFKLWNNKDANKIQTTENNGLCYLS